MNAKVRFFIRDDAEAFVNFYLDIIYSYCYFFVSLSQTLKCLFT